ncbi:MAG: tetratricopeptide repeat protein [Polyangiaceae bacterium]
MTDDDELDEEEEREAQKAADERKAKRAERERQREAVATAPASDGGSLKKPLGAVVALALLAALGWGGMEYKKQADLKAFLATCDSNVREACEKRCDGAPPEGKACTKAATLYSSKAGEGTRDEVKATSYYHKACDANDLEGCARYAKMLLNGTGVAKDPPQATKYFQKACDGGNAFGCAGLGHLYAKGEGGLTKDEAKGVELFKKSCDQGEPRGCAHLGVAYLNGLSVKQDLDKAKQLFEDSCSKNEDRGCLGKAVMLFNGQNGTRDENTAIELFRKACEGESKDACAYLATAYMTGQGVGRDINRAAAWFREACDGAAPAGCVEIAQLYAAGQGVQQDPVASIQAFQKACDTGNPDGCVAIGRAMISGMGVQPDPNKGALMIKDACEKGGSIAGCTQLAMIELQGVGPISKNVEAAEARVAKACEAKHPQACSILGSIYMEKSRTIEKDKIKVDNALASKGVELFKKACESGDADGCAFYGGALFDGQGIQKNHEEGLKMLAGSCEQLGSGRGCGMYAQVLIMGDGKDNDQIAKGVKIAEQMCANGEAQLCLMAAASYLEGRGVKKDLNRGSQIVVATCAAGMPQACALQQRLPPELVAAANRTLAEAAAQAQAQGMLPPGTPIPGASGSAAPPGAPGAPGAPPASSAKH